MVILPYASLHPDQQAVVQDRHHIVRVTGGPGSGKTITAIARYLHLLSEPSICPQHLLFLTWSSVHAAEIRDLLIPHLPAGITAYWIETFQSCADRLLKQYTHRIQGLSACYRRLSEFEQWCLMREVLASTPLRSYLRQAVDLDALVQTMLEQIRFFKQNLIEPEEFLAIAHNPAAPDSVADVADVYAAYNALIVQRHFMDSNDLVKVAVELLRQPDICRIFHRQFRHIIVDEMQELDPAQLQLLKMLHHPDQTLTAFGDPDQSVFGFRGAVPEAFGATFLKLFPDTIERHLSRGFRTPGVIHSCAVRAIRQFAGSGAGMTTSRTGLTPPVQLKREFNTAAECAWIAAEIRELVGRSDSAPLHYRDIAVILRSMGDYTDLLCSAFDSVGIPRRCDPPAPLLRTESCRLLLDVLWCMTPGVQPDTAGRLLHYDPVGLPPVLGRRIFHDEHLSGDSFVDRAAGLSAPGSPSRRLLEFIAAAAEKQPVAPLTAIQDAAVLVLELYTGRPDFDEHMESLRDFTVALRVIVNNATHLNIDNSLHGVLQFLAGRELDGVLLNRRRPREPEYDCVTISTVHAAKGREYPVVFLPQLQDELFPSRFNSDQLLEMYVLECVKACIERKPEGRYVSMRAEDHATHLASEAKLWYVALTRASARVYCSWVRMGEQDEQLQPSLFLDQLAGGPVDQWMDAMDVRQEPPGIRRLPEWNADVTLLTENVSAAIVHAPDSVSLNYALRRLLYLKDRIMAPDSAVSRRILQLSAPFGNANVINAGQLFASMSAESFRLSEHHTCGPTRISCFERCPRKYFYQFVAGLTPEPSVHLAAGSLMHEVLQRLYEADAAPAPQHLNPVFQSVWPQYSEQFGSVQEQYFWHQYLYGRLEDFLATIAPQLGTPLKMEILADVRLASGLRMRGRIDRIDQSPDGIEIIDYKKSGSGKETSLINAILRPFGVKEERHIQLPLYAAMLQADQHIEPVKLTLIYLDFDNKRTAVPVSIPVKDAPHTGKMKKWLTPAELRSVQADIEQFAASMYDERLDFPRGPQAQCRDQFTGIECDFFRMCPVARIEQS